jgi:3-hydroxy-3-methylglutaryl CoA synthase/uncharacterized OB-fold protein
MRGILSWGVHVPYRRLDRSTIAAVAGSGGGKGTRSAASYDEDTTTMGVEAARLTRRAAPEIEPSALWFATASPAYLDKTNATTVHAALRLSRATPAYDALGSVRSSMGALRAGLDGAAGGATLVVTADLRTGLPGGADEANGGDGAAAVLVGDDGSGAPVLAEVLAWGTATEEFLDRWRTPGDVRSKLWEERFGEVRYTALGIEAWEAALKQAELTADQVDHLIVTGTHSRACAAVVKKVGVSGDRLVDGLEATVGNTGAAHPLLLLSSALDRAKPGQVVALVVLADGADVVLLGTTEALASHETVRPVAEQIGAAGPVAYGKYLAWRGLLPVEPPRRPEPARPSASAAARTSDWKFGFVASERDDGTVHLPPSPHDQGPRPMAEAVGTVVTYTIDKLAYSPSPPVVFAVVDFDGGGRLPIELTDVDPSDVAIGSRVEMTFRRMFTADGIHNYFWKARPQR